MRSGITPVVAVVLLLMMTVAAAGAGYAWVQQIQDEAQEETSRELAGRVVVKDLQCYGSTASIHLSNTGDTIVSATTGTAYLYEGGDLVATRSVNVSGKGFLQPGGNDEVSTAFQAKMDRGTRYTVELELGTDRTVEASCTSRSTLVGYWSFDTADSNSTHVFDLAEGNDAVLSGDAQPGVPGVDGEGILFDGSGDAATVGNPSVLQVTGDLTIAFWANTRNFSAQRENPIDKAYGGEYTLTFEDDDRVHAYFGSAGSNSNPYAGPAWSNVQQDDTWLFVVWRRDNSAQESELFVNGTSRGAKTAWEDPVASPDEVIIGSGYTNSFNGTLDEMRIYSSALSDDRIQTLFESAGR